MTDAEISRLREELNDAESELETLDAEFVCVMRSYSEKAAYVGDLRAFYLRQMKLRQLEQQRRADEPIRLLGIQ